MEDLENRRISDEFEPGTSLARMTPGRTIFYPEVIDPREYYSLL